MSGKKFLEVLQRIGYPKASKLDDASFDWIFECDAVIPFLDWFCDEVQANNRLEPEDIDEFVALEQSGDDILDGEQLEEVLQTFSEGEGQISEDQLRQEVEQLENDLRNQQQRKELLIQQRNRLSQHKTLLASRLSKVEVFERQSLAQYQQRLEQTAADNSKMNAALDRIMVAVGELIKLYKETKPREDDLSTEAKPRIFLSQIPLDEFFRMEEKFTTELTTFTKKKFFEGIAEIAGSNHNTYFELLDLSNPETLTVLGEKSPEILEACKEIARLQSHYPKNETLLINALVEEKAANIICDFTEKKLHQLKEKPYPVNQAQLKGYLEDAQMTLRVLCQELTFLGENEIPALIKDSAKLQVTCLLSGNYDLKIARQDYFMENQDQITEQLLIQKSRYEFVTMAYELEAKDHRNTYRLLKAIRSMLENAACLQKEILKMLRDPMLSAKCGERNTLDSQDKFFTKLHQLLDTNTSSSQPQLFITYKQLIDGSETLNNHLLTLRAQSSAAHSSQNEKTQILEKALKSCEATLYSDSNSQSGKPRINPQAIDDLIRQLNGMLKQLETSILDVIKDVEQKRKTLLMDPLLVAERELFVHFFIDHDRLRRTLLNVSEKLETHLVE